MMKFKAMTASIRRSSFEILEVTKQIITQRPTSRIDLRQVLLQTSNNNDASSPSSSSSPVTSSLTSFQPQQNLVALNLLKFDKEINLIEYHGLKYYMQNNVSLPQSLSFVRTWTSASHGNSSSSSQSSNDNEHDRSNSRSTNPSSSSSLSNSSSDNNNNNNKNHNKSIKAQVAFMITAQQRQLLMSKYQYTQKEIKSMKPNEAQIILEHSIHAVLDRDSKSPWKEHVQEIIMIQKEEEQKHKEMTNLEELEQQQRRETNLEESQQQQQQQMEEVDQRVSDTHMVETMSNTLGTTASSNNILSIGFEERPLDNIYHPTEEENNKVLQLIPDKNDKSATLNNEEIKKNQRSSLATETRDIENSIHKHDWFEVVETSPTSEEQAIALFKTEEEAEEFIRIKEDLLSKRNKQSATMPLQERAKFVIQKRIV